MHIFIPDLKKKKKVYHSIWLRFSNSSEQWLGIGEAVLPWQTDVAPVVL